MPMAVYTFLEHFDWSGKRIHPFCTHEGSGMSGTEGKIAQTCPGATVCKGLAIHGSHIEDSRKTIQSWAAGK